MPLQSHSEFSFTLPNPAGLLKGPRGVRLFEGEAPLGASPTFERLDARRRVAKHRETQLHFRTAHLRHRTHGYIYATRALQADLNPQP